MTREVALAELKDTIKGSYYQCCMKTYEMASKHGTAVPERRIKRNDL